MTAESPLIFPRGRNLAGWWKQLARLQPRAVWLGHIRLHRVEALAGVHLSTRVDPLRLFALKALALTGPTTLPDLDEHLHLGLPLLHQLLRQLEREQLVHLAEEGDWSLTARGRQGLEQGSYPCERLERRTFYFVESEQPTQPPHFLKLRRPSAALAWPGVDGQPFEPALLHECIHQSMEWKERFDFPLEVQQILGFQAEGESGRPASQAWRRVVLDRIERLVAALVLVPAAEKAAVALTPQEGSAAPAVSRNPERLLGFAVRPDGWELQAGEPVFLLKRDWQEVFPELALGLPPDQWRLAWREWCRPRGLPATDVDACIIEQHGCRLRVTAPAALVEHLRAARSDVLKGEAWLLAGAGRLRAAAQIELHEMKAERAGQPLTGRA